MTTNNTTDSDSSVSHKKIDQIVFSALIVLAVVGVVITDISPTNAHGYWVFTLVAYACTVIFCGRKLANAQEKNFGRFVVEQIIHWGGSLVAILCVYTLVHTGTITYAEAGAIMLLILALATFLAGSHAGWRFYVLGALLALTTVLMAYIEEFMWIIVLVAIVIIASTYFFTRHKTTE